MFKGVIFKRALIMCVIILLLCNIFLVAAYSQFGKRTYIKLELDSLSSVSDAAIDFYYIKDSMFASRSYFFQALQLLSKMNDVSVYYYDGITQQAYTTLTENDYTGLNEIIVGAMATGERVSIPKLTLDSKTNVICTGAPLYNQNNELEGCVLFLRDIRHIDEAFDKLNSVLWIMVAAILPLMLVFTFISIRQLSKPINAMTDVAIELAKGNYEVRANENYSGEMGIFARAMNQMSEALSSTIHQLDSEKRQLSYILSSFSEGVAALDNLGNLTHYNPALMKMFGAVDVTSPIDLIPDNSIWDAFMAVLDSKEPRTLHYELPGERMLWISIVPVITDNGDCTGVVGLFKDISEIEKLERVRRDYVANISHELRTPLTAVRGLLEPLADNMVKDEATRQRYYGIMLHEIERLSRLITDMLQLSRLQSGTEYMEVRQFDIKDLISDVAQGYQTEVSKRGIRLEIDLCDAHDVVSDPDRIEQVLVVLLDNAMRYAGAKPNGLIRITTTQDTGYVYITVLDNGCGISQEDLPHIFERFYKADKSRKEGGTGLGLSIAKQVLDKLGEHIEVSSVQGEWTNFVFSVKKYVSNAIQLGPVDENTLIYHGDGEPAAVDKSPSDEKPSIDAPYEVLDANDTRSKRDKKRMK